MVISHGYVSHNQMVNSLDFDAGKDLTGADRCIETHSVALQRLHVASSHSRPWGPTLPSNTVHHGTTMDNSWQLHQLLKLEWHSTNCFGFRFFYVCIISYALRAWCLCQVLFAHANFRGWCHITPKKWSEHAKKLHKIAKATGQWQDFSQAVMAAPGFHQWFFTHLE